MKKNLLLSATVLLASACYAADVSFSLTFDGKTLNPESSQGDTKPIKALTLTDDNFVKGLNNKEAFVLTKQESPGYTANGIVNFGESTVSFWFKPVNWIQDKPARFLHIFSPSQDKKSLLIYYFYKNAEGDIAMKIVGSNDARKDVAEVTIPGDSIAKDAWQKIDVVWNAKTLTIYRNGEKVDEKPMFDAFAALAQAPRDWTGFYVLPVYTSDGDDWNVKTAMDNITVYKNALTDKEIKENYSKDMESASK
ncbi:MAG: LamG domain-containing protein [Lentisphaerota bacterium]